MAGILSSTASQTGAIDPNAPNTSTDVPTLATPSPATTPATADQINSIYESTFGRPADQAGLAYWQNISAQNPGADMSTAIAGGAQGDDKSAEAAVSGDGSLAANFSTPGLNDANVTGDTWDATTNQWIPAATVTSGIPAAIPTTAATYQAAQLGTPTQLNVAPNQTVQGQLSTILDPNNPLMQQASTGALQQMNSRGLLNSSMGITAADDAAYSAAIPIATADASTYNNAAATNAGTANAFTQQNANMTNTAGQFNAGAQNTLTGEQLSNQTSLTNAQLAATTQLQNTALQTGSAQDIAQLNANTSTTITNLNNTQQTELANIGNADKNLIQNNSTAAAAYSTYAQVLYNNSVANMDVQAKYDADLTAFNAYKQQISVAATQMNVPDVSSQLVFNEIDPSTQTTAPPATPPPATGILNGPTNSWGGQA